MHITVAHPDTVRSMFSWWYRVYRFLARVIINIFFSRIEVVGASEVPHHGPVIFSGFHPNGLIDPMMIVATCPRRVHLIGKDTLFRVPCLGAIARGVGAIPILRRQDHAAESNVNNNSAFEAIFKALAHSECITIFPEGISHDKPEIQELKSGIARISLGACERFNLPLKIVPVGLNYVRGDEFRSKVLVHFGPAIEVTREMIEEYKADQRAAVKSLLKIVETGMRGVTVNASDWETIQLAHLSCDLYAPPHYKWSLHARTRLMRSFAETYNKVADMEHMRELRAHLAAYNETLQMLDMTDAQLRKGQRSKLRSFFEVIWNVIFLCVFIPLSVAGYVLNAPVALYAKYKSKQLGAKQGRDVIATYKLVVVFVLLPLLYVFYTILAAVLLHYLTNTLSGALWALILFFGLPLFTYITVRVSEGRAQAWTRFKLVFKTWHNKEQIKCLQQVRSQLVDAVRTAVQIHAPPDAERVLPQGAVPHSDYRFNSWSFRISEESRLALQTQILAAEAAHEEQTQEIEREIDDMDIHDSIDVDSLAVSMSEQGDVSSPVSSITSATTSTSVAEEQVLVDFGRQSASGYGSDGRQGGHDRTADTTQASGSGNVSSI